MSPRQIFASQGPYQADAFSTLGASAGIGVIPATPANVYKRGTKGRPYWSIPKEGSQVYFHFKTNTENKAYSNKGEQRVIIFLA